MAESKRAHLARLQRLMSLLGTPGEFGRLRQLTFEILRRYGRQENYVSMIIDFLVASGLKTNQHSAAA